MLMLLLALLLIVSVGAVVLLLAAGPTRTPEVPVVAGLHGRVRGAMPEDEPSAAYGVLCSPEASRRASERFERAEAGVRGAVASLALVLTAPLRLLLRGLAALARTARTVVAVLRDRRRRAALARARAARTRAERRAAQLAEAERAAVERAAVERAAAERAAQERAAAERAAAERDVGRGGRTGAGGRRGQAGPARHRA